MLLGLINSTIVLKWLRYRGKLNGETLVLYYEPLSEIPIPTITPQNQPIVDKIEELVGQILEIKGGNDVGGVADSTEYLETQIDTLVFNLYGLTEEERAVVLGG